MTLPELGLLVVEKIEWDKKHADLMAFIRSPTFATLSADEQYRLRDQDAAMVLYSRALAGRIAAFDA